MIENEYENSVNILAEAVPEEQPCYLKMSQLFAGFI